MQKQFPIYEILERLPPLTLADLKPGEMVLVSGARGNDPSRLTAIVVAAGVEPLITQIRTVQQPGGVSLGLPGSVTDALFGSSSE